MKENKLIIGKNICDLLFDMTDKQAGELIKGVVAYAFGGKPFRTKDDYLKGVFLYVKREIDVANRNSINGKKGAEKRTENRRKRAEAGVIVQNVMVVDALPKDNNTTD